MLRNLHTIFFYTLLVYIANNSIKDFLSLLRMCSKMTLNFIAALCFLSWFSVVLGTESRYMSMLDNPQVNNLPRTTFVLLIESHSHRSEVRRPHYGFNAHRSVVLSIFPCTPHDVCMSLGEFLSRTSVYFFTWLIHFLAIEL